VVAQVRPSIAVVVSNFKRIRQVAALSRANRGISLAFLYFLAVSRFSPFLVLTHEDVIYLLSGRYKSTGH